MNSLSWFIYLTQMVDNVSTAACVILVGGVLVGIFGGMALSFMVEDRKITSDAARRYIKYFIVTMACSLVIAVLVPDRRTMLLIAGSEIGDRAINSQQVRDVVDPGMELLKTWIKRETERLTKDAAK